MVTKYHRSSKMEDAGMVIGSKFLRTKPWLQSINFHMSSTNRKIRVFKYVHMWACEFPVSRASQTSPVKYLQNGRSPIAGEACRTSKLVTSSD